jgi:hypothetical protein
VIDYSKGQNLASTVINEKLRVSTATFPRSEYYGGGEDSLIETWVFSDDGIHSRRQIFSRTRKHALMVHDMVVGILK